MSAYTVNSGLYNPLPDPSGKPSPEQERPAFLYAATRRRGLPGPPTDNRWEQSKQFVDATYIAIQRLMDGLGAASVKILKRQAGGQGALTGGDAKKGKDWVPVESSHPAQWLFEHINTQDTLTGFLSTYVMCRRLFGRTFVYAVPGRSGKPSELWVIRPQHLYPAFGPTADYPFGAWRLTVPTTWSYGFAQAGTAVLDARHVIDDKLPHPQVDYDGYSPLTAGALILDALRSVNEARKNAVEKGTSLDAFFCLPGASKEELEYQREEHRRRNSGANGDRVLFTGAEDVKATALGIAPKDMGFDGAYEQLTRAAAALQGVPGGIADMTDVTSFAQLFASIQQFQTMRLQPEADAIAAVWTKHLIRPHWGADLKLVIELPKLMDQDEMKQRRQSLFAAGGVTVNEERGALDLEPVEGGDVPPAVYLQMEQQKAQPQPMVGAMGGVPGGLNLPGLTDTDGQMTQGDGGQADAAGADSADGGADNPLAANPGQDAISGAVLQALGVQGGDEPGMVRKAWTRFTTKTGGVGARNEQGRELYGEDAEAALAAQQGGGAAPADGGGGGPKPGTHRVSYTVGGKQQVADVPAASEEEAHQIVTALGGKVDKPAAGGGKPRAAGKKPKAAPPGESADRTLGQMQAETRPVERLGADELESEWDRLMSLDEKRELDPDERERYAAVDERVQANRAAAMEEYNRPTGAAGGRRLGETEQKRAGAASPTSAVTQPSGADDAPLPPKAIPIARRAIPVLKPAAAKLAQNPQARQAAEAVHEWGPAVAKRHAAAVAAANNLDAALAHDLILHLLEHLVRIIPGVGRGASLGVGLLRRYRLHQAAKQVRDALQTPEQPSTVSGDTVRPEVRDAMRQAGRHQGVSSDTSISRSGPTRPRNPNGVGSLPRRVGKSRAAVEYARRVMQSLGGGSDQRVTKAAAPGDGWVGQQMALAMTAMASREPVVNVTFPAPPPADAGGRRRGGSAGDPDPLSGC